MGHLVIRHMRLTSIEIPFRVAFRHASASREQTSSVWVESHSGIGAIGYGESCPRPYVTGETLKTTRAFFERHETELTTGVGGLESLEAWMRSRTAEIDRNPAAWCAIELSLLDLFAKDRGQTVEGLLALPALRGAFTYTAVLGDASLKAFHAMAGEYVGLGFRDFKVKLAGDGARDAEKIEALKSVGHGHDLRVRVDANNLWTDRTEALAALRALDHPLFAVEEPLTVNRYEDLAWLGAHLGCAVVLDESLLRASQVRELPEPPGRWLINLRLSKMGGVLRSLEVVGAARAAGIQIVVGAQVGETSLLTRAALTVANAARDVLVAQEGAFGTFLLERDVCEPPLMFGAGGMLEVSRFPALQSPGFGINPAN